jgi:arylsulfatase A-like enzyme
MKRAAVFLLFSLLQLASRAVDRPNIIFITTDQQSATMMSCAGNPWLKTPAMDYLAEHGIRFERAYSANPVCAPARVAMMSGRFPSYFEKGDGVIRDNRAAGRIRDLSPEVAKSTLAAYLKTAGYALAYGGKSHLPKPLSPAAQGFENIGGEQGDELAAGCADYIRRSHDRPFFLWANFINPHDICFFAINYYRFGLDKDDPLFRKRGRANEELIKALQMPDGVGEAEFFAKYCPPLPANHAPQIDEPAAVTRLINERPFRLRARENYSDKDWRLHRWAYHRLTERVDGQLQVLLDALRESGREQNTVFILTSDHGDHSGAHKMEHKSTCYEEAARIPFLVMHRGHKAEGLVDRQHLVSSGLDLLPTVCDYAGVAGAQADPRGRSLRPLIEGRPVADWRRTLGVESEVGRMVVGDYAKYVRYDLVPERIQEQLLDLKKDPGETRHFTHDPGSADLLKDLRRQFDEVWFPKQ